jgi:predicted XRE-type DNA-binding protein
MAKRSQNDDMKITASSGNVFADIGLANSDELLAKADLAIAIKKEIDAQGWTQAQAAERVFLSQPQISKIRRMKLDEFSRDKLQEVLRNLGIDVEITLHKREDGGIGTLRVLQPN